MTIVCNKRFDASKIEWQGPATSVFASDLASLASGGCFGRIYDDACDIGCTFINHSRTTEATFYVSHEEINREGELQYTDLLPIPETLRKYPGLANVRIRVWND